MALAAPIWRQNVRWLSGRPAPTLTLVDDQKAAFKRTFASSLLMMRASVQAAAPLKERAKWSQKALAPRVIASEATYRRWENPEDERFPDAYQLNRLCDELGCEPDDLVRPEPLSPREIALARAVTRGRKKGLTQGRRAAKRRGESPEPRPPQADDGSPR